jgi:hypothetical protein
MHNALILHAIKKIESRQRRHLLIGSAFSVSNRMPQNRIEPTIAHMIFCGVAQQNAFFIKAPDENF